MKVLIKIIATITLPLIAVAGMAETTRDCMLKGTVQKGAGSEEQGVNVKFHSVRKYDEDASCRVRRGEKMEFKLPADPRVQEAEPGSSVQYRHRTDSDGNSKTELVSIGT